MNSKNPASLLPGGNLFPSLRFGNTMIAGILILISAAVYSPVLQADFLWYDDDMMVFNNPLIKQFDLGSLKELFGFQNIVHYHPLVYFSYVLEYSLFGLNPFYFHLTNLLLHCINVILVYFFVLRISGSKLVSILTAVLFAVHPLHVESVAWVTERKDLLYSFFYVSSLICYIKYREKSSINSYDFSLALFFLSCLSKAMAVTLPFVLIIIDRYIFGVKKINIKEKIPYLIISAIFIFINLNVNYYKTDTVIYTLYERISLVCYSVLFYPVKTFFPLELSAIYSYPLKPGIIFLASPVILFIFISVLTGFKKLSGYTKFGLLFYMITILPVLPVLPFGISLTADRFSYIPMTGLLYIFAVAVTGFLYRPHFVNKKLRFPVIALLVSLILVLSYAAFLRAGYWENTETLMTDSIRKDSSNCHAYFILGNYFSDNNRNEEAIKNYTLCLRIINNFRDAHYNLGNAYFRSGNLQMAINCFLRVVEIDPADKLAYNNLGVAYENLGDYEKAISFYKVSAGLGYEPASKVLNYYRVLK